MKIALYCHGDEKTGLGHLTRSATIIKDIEKKRNINIKVIVKTENAYKDYFTSIKTEIVYLKSYDRIYESLKDFSPDAIIFDSIYFEKNKILKLKDSELILVSISPIFNCNKHMNIIFTRNNIYHESKKPLFISGLEYVTINRDIPRVDDKLFQKRLEDKKLNVGITLGGSDAKNQTKSVLRRISGIKDCRIWVLLGEGYEHSFDQLVEISKMKNSNEIILVKAGSSIWEILSLCSLVIVSGGLTILECAFAGIPTLNIFHKKKHLEVSSPIIFDRGASINLGIFSDSVLRELEKKIKYFCKNKIELTEMRQSSKGLINRNGGMNIIDKIIEISSQI